MYVFFSSGSERRQLGQVHPRKQGPRAGGVLGTVVRAVQDDAASDG